MTPIHRRRRRRSRNENITPPPESAPVYVVDGAPVDTGSAPLSIPAGISTLGLIVSNLVAAWIALRQGWGLGDFMTLYWCQSIIIGLFNFLRIFSFRQFDPGGVRMNRRAIDTSRKSQFQVGYFFFIHYGGFHLGYLALVDQEFRGDPIQAGAILLCAAIFFVHHAMAFFEQHASDVRSRPDIGTAMLFPYARIIPMHLTPFIASAATAGDFRLIVFVVLKILADVIMHLIELSGMKKRRRAATQGAAAPSPTASASARPLVPAEPASRRWRVFGILLVLISGAVTYLLCPKILWNLWNTTMVDRVEVPCTIVEVRDLPAGRRQPARVIVQFSYTYEGKAYTSTRPNPLERVLPQRTQGSRPRYVAGIYPPGSTQTCFVNPRAPENAVLEKDPPVTLVLSLLVGSLLPLFLFVSGVYVVRGSRRLTG